MAVKILTGSDVVQLTVGSTDTWVNVDLDSFYASLPSDVSGAIIMVTNSATSTYACGARPGAAFSGYSNFTRVTSFRGESSTASGNIYVACDSSHCIELYSGNNTYLKFYLIGYFTTAISWRSSPQAITVTAGSWQTVDISTYVDSSAKFAIIEWGQSGASTRGDNLREPSASDNRLPTYDYYGHKWAIVPLDSSKNLEYYAENATANFIDIIGSITDGTQRTSGGDVSLGVTGSYQTVDFSSLSPPSDGYAAIIETYSTVANRSNFRPYGDTTWPAALEVYCSANSVRWELVPIDSSDRAQAWISNTGIDYYCWGYLPEAGAAPPSARPFPQRVLYGSLRGPMGGPL